MIISGYQNFQFKSVYFGIKLASEEIEKIKKELARMDSRLKKAGIKEVSCGKITAQTRSRKEESLKITKARYNGESLYLVRKPNPENTLLGYVTYKVEEGNKVINDLYGLHSRDLSYINCTCMLADGQDEYKDLKLGKKLHQLIIETSILEKCPGRVYIAEAFNPVAGISPVGFHYGNGYVPRKFGKYGFFIRDERIENKIKKDMEKSGYTRIDDISMFLSPEGFKQWQREIAEKPLLNLRLGKKLG